MGNWPSILRTAQNVIADGVYPPLNLSGLAAGTLQAAHLQKAVVKGLGFGFRINDGCREWLLDVFDVDQTWRGVWATISQGGRLRNLRVQNSGMDGILLGGCIGTVVDSCVV